MLKTAPERAKPRPKSSHAQILGDCRSTALQGHGGPNPYPFAPGVIDGPDLTSSGGLAIEVVVVVIALVAVAAALGFACGYLNLPGWLL